MNDLRCLYNGGVAYRTRIDSALPPDERKEALAMLAAQSAAVVRARLAESGKTATPETLTAALRELGGISAVVSSLIGPEPSPAINTHGMPEHADWWRWRALSDSVGQVRFQVQLLLSR